jgi:hypothetical protein
LRKRPKSETLCAFQGLGMKITAILFFEANTEDSVVQLAACTSLTDDRTKARDEQYIDVSHLCRVISCSYDESGLHHHTSRHVESCDSFNLMHNARCWTSIQSGVMV